MNRAAAKQSSVKDKLGLFLNCETHKATPRNDHILFSGNWTNKENTYYSILFPVSILKDILSSFPVFFFLWQNFKAERGLFVWGNQQEFFQILCKRTYISWGVCMTNVGALSIYKSSKCACVCVAIITSRLTKLANIISLGQRSECWGFGWD